MKAINLLPKSVKRELQLELISSQVLNLWMGVLVTLAMFFVLVLAASFYIRSEIQSISTTIAQQQQELQSSDTKTLEAEVTALNNRITGIRTLQNNHYYWSQTLTELGEIMPADLQIETLTLDRATGQVELVGTGGSRDSVLAFWASVIQSDYFRDINFPLANLERAQDAQFTFTFFINPEVIKNEPIN